MEASACRDLISGGNVVSSRACGPQRGRIAAVSDALKGRDQLNCWSITTTSVGEHLRKEGCRMSGYCAVTNPTRKLSVNDLSCVAPKSAVLSGNGGRNS
jgi:hypothetical protein